jgi:nicotinate-nucleotide pyrophosphorylase (carboxylating)
MLPEPLIDEAVRRALQEDRPWGDLTSDTLLPAGLEARLTLRCKQPGVICGLPIARAAFRVVDPECHWEAALEDGARVEPGAALAMVRGDARLLLQGERVALNFLQRLSGIATLTAAFVARARQGSPRATVIDTRKTTPGLRALEKYAVRAGGGTNHRFGLSDGVLVKDNHLAALAHAGVGLKEALAAARRAIPHTARIEVEVESAPAAREAMEAGADILLLDNMSIEAMREVVAFARGRCLIEASGNMSLERIVSVAATGVDLISVGALTHSAPALDISLDFEV